MGRSICALETLPRFSPLPAFRPDTTWYADEGYVYLLAGDAARAAPLLEKGPRRASRSRARSSACTRCSTSARARRSAIAPALSPAASELGYRVRMIHGAHVILYSKDADADRAFFRDVLKYEHADAGHGWLIFALPPAEIAVHPSKKNDVHELYLMCDDVKGFVADMKRKKIACGPIEQQPWGALTHLTLPGGGKLGVYQPRHASPIAKKKIARKTVKRR